MLAALLLVVARRERGRRALRALAEHRVAVKLIDQAVSLEVDEAASAGRPQLSPLIEPRVTVALLRLLANVEANADVLPDRIVEAARDARAVAGEWGALARSVA